MAASTILPIMRMDMELAKLKTQFNEFKLSAKESPDSTTQDSAVDARESRIDDLTHRINHIEARLDDLKHTQASCAKKERSITEAVILQKVDALVTAQVQTSLALRTGADFEAKLADTIRARMDGVITERIEIAARKVLAATAAMCKDEVNKLRSEQDPKDEPAPTPPSASHPMLEDAPSLDLMQSARSVDPAETTQTPDADEIETTPQQPKRTRARRT